MQSQLYYYTVTRNGKIVDMKHFKMIQQAAFKACKNFNH